VAVAVAVVVLVLVLVLLLLLLPLEDDEPPLDDDVPVGVVPLFASVMHGLAVVDFWPALQTGIATNLAVDVFAALHGFLAVECSPFVHAATFAWPA
jgi:hypothetical protein